MQKTFNWLPLFFCFLCISVTLFTLSQSLTTCCCLLYRDDEYSKLSPYLEEQPKVASRKSYIQQIKEITKSSRKQDTDTERILKETREVQLESNSIRERLHRTYAVADEIVFRYRFFHCCQHTEPCTCKHKYTHKKWRNSKHKNRKEQRQKPEHPDISSCECYRCVILVDLVSHQQ